MGLRSLNIKDLAGNREANPEDQILDLDYWIQSLNNVTKLDFDQDHVDLKEVMVIVPYECESYYEDRLWEDINCLKPIDRSHDRKHTIQNPDNREPNDVEQGQRSDPIRNANSKLPMIVRQKQNYQHKLKELDRVKQDDHYLEFISLPSRLEGKTEQEISEFLRKQIKLLNDRAESGQLNRDNQKRYLARIARMKDARECYKRVSLERTPWDKYNFAFRHPSWSPILLERKLLN